MIRAETLLSVLDQPLKALSVFENIVAFNQQVLVPPSEVNVAVVAHKYSAALSFALFSEFALIVGPVEILFLLDSFATAMHLIHKTLEPLFHLGVRADFEGESFYRYLLTALVIIDTLYGFVVCWQIAGHCCLSNDLRNTNSVLCDSIVNDVFFN